MFAKLTMVFPPLMPVIIEISVIPITIIVVRVTIITIIIVREIIITITAIIPRTT